jgi:hypothetical protein
MPEPPAVHQAIRARPRPHRAWAISRHTPTSQRLAWTAPQGSRPWRRPGQQPTARGCPTGCPLRFGTVASCRSRKISPKYRRPEAVAMLCGQGKLELNRRYACATDALALYGRRLNRSSACSRITPDCSFPLSTRAAHLDSFKE